MSVAVEQPTTGGARPLTGRLASDPVQGAHSLSCALEAIDATQRAPTAPPSPWDARDATPPLASRLSSVPSVGPLIVAVGLGALQQKQASIQQEIQEVQRLQDQLRQLIPLQGKAAAFELEKTDPLPESLHLELSALRERGIDLFPDRSPDAEPLSKGEFLLGLSARIDDYKSKVQTKMHTSLAPAFEEMKAMIDSIKELIKMLHNLNSYIIQKSVGR